MKNDKVDKGFELIYWKLSYRRKLIRTLWLLPFTLILCVIMTLLTIDIDKKIPIIFTIILVSATTIQLIYNYYMWQKKETHKNDKK